MVHTMAAAMAVGGRACNSLALPQHPPSPAAVPTPRPFVLASWRTAVVQAMIAQGRACNVEPGHDPWPYQQSMPSTGVEPSHDIWGSNGYAIKLARGRWPAIAGAAV